MCMSIKQAVQNSRQQKMLRKVWNEIPVLFITTVQQENKLLRFIKLWNFTHMR